MGRQRAIPANGGFDSTPWPFPVRRAGESGNRRSLVVHEHPVSRPRVQGEPLTGVPRVGLRGTRKGRPAEAERPSNQGPLRPRSYSPQVQSPQLQVSQAHSLHSQVLHPQSPQAQTAADAPDSARVEAARMAKSVFIGFPFIGKFKKQGSAEGKPLRPTGCLLKLWEVVQPGGRHVARRIRGRGKRRG